MEARWSFTANHAGRSLILPDGRCDIILRYNVHSSNSPAPIITGPATQPYWVEYATGDSWLGLRLRPASAGLLWQDQLERAVDIVLRGEAVFERLPKLATVNGCNLTLNHLAMAIDITTTCVVDQRLIRSIETLHGSGGRMRVEKLSEYVGCTSRQLNRLFRSNVGLSTKVYSQLLQFHRTLKLIQRDNLSITDAAFEGGYSDHAHLTRAFKRFGGFTPSNVPQSLVTPSLFS